MTLSTQNKLLLRFSAFSALVCISLITGIVFYFINTDTIQPASSFFAFFTMQNSLATIFSLLLFSAYVPIAGFTLYSTFEKTKSAEMLYYTAMLIGFFSESIRLCIPIFSLARGYTLFLDTICRLAFFGQMQIILAILVQAVLAQNESRDSDKFMGLISVIALSFSIIIPVETTDIAQSFSAQYGFAVQFKTMRLIFISIAFFSMYISPNGKKFPAYKKASFAFLIMCIGYFILLDARILLFFIIGAIFLIAGTSIYLKQLHKYYMWK